MHLAKLKQSARVMFNLAC